MQDKASNNRQDIAGVLAELCEELYTQTTKSHEPKHEHENKFERHRDTMEPFTMQELNDAINQLEKGKATDTRGVNADMIKCFTR